MKTRRCFLKVLGASAVALPACGGDDPPVTTGPTGPTGTGGGGMCGPEVEPFEIDMLTPSGINVSDLGEGEIAAVEGEAPTFAWYVGRDACGIYAMTSLCAHAGCDMRQHPHDELESPGAALHCDCHGSEYDEHGEVVSDGPATHELDHYVAYIDESGDIHIDSFTYTTPDTRTPIT